MSGWEYLSPVAISVIFCAPAAASAEGDAAAGATALRAAGAGDEATVAAVFARVPVLTPVFVLLVLLLLLLHAAASASIAAHAPSAMKCGRTACMGGPIVRGKAPSETAWCAIS